jgi:DnaK suppressor protein
MAITIDLKEIRQILEKQNLAIRKELAKLAEGIGRPEVNASDPSALAERYVLQQRRSNAQIRLARKLEQVNAALQRLDQGKYGICEACRQRIQPGRLQVIPHTELCIHCQAVQEKLGITL